MSGLFQSTFTEAQGTPASPANLDRIHVTMGCSSLGSGLSGFYSSASSAQAALGYGDAVDTMCQAIEQRTSSGGGGEKWAGQLYTTPASTPATFGTIDVTGVTGTALVTVDAATLPYGTYNAQLKVIAGFTVGTIGGSVQWSLDNGITFSNTVAIGTADFYLIQSGNVKFNFNPTALDLTATNTLINELFGDLNAHVILVTGTVHTNADTVDQVSAGTYPVATNTVTRVARINALIAAAKLHFVKGTGGTPATHITAGGDAAGLVLLNAIPVATDDETALAAALLLKAAFNTHLGSTVWHTIADATNTTTSPAPSPGTLIAGDVVKVRTVAPMPSAADIDAAFVALASASGNIGVLALEFPLTAALAAHVTTGLNLLISTKGKRPALLARTRIRNVEAAETEAAWVASIAADFVNFNDDRIVLDATYGLITDATTTRQYFRSLFAQLVADTVRVERYEMPGVPADKVGVGIPNVTLVDATGALVGHDEGDGGAVTGLSNDTLGNRFTCVQRMPDAQAPEAVYRTVPWTLYAPSSLIKNLPTRRVANAIESAVATVSIRQLGKSFGYIPANPNIPGSLPKLTPTALRSLQAAVFQAISVSFSNDIQNSADANITTGLVQVNPVVVITGGNLITVSITTAPKVLGYLLKIINTLSIKS